MEERGRMEGVEEEEEEEEEGSWRVDIVMRLRAHKGVEEGAGQRAGPEDVWVVAGGGAC